MAQATINQLRHLVRTLNYVVSLHAAEELEDDNLNILDLESMSSPAKSSSVSATSRRVKSSTSLLAPRSTARKEKSSPKSASPTSSSSSLSTVLEKECAHCGSRSVQLKHVTRSFGRGATLLVVEGVPLWSCPSCGESYFTASTMHEIERIKALRNSIAVKRTVPVASFAAADA